MPAVLSDRRDTSYPGPYALRIFVLDICTALHIYNRYDTTSDVRATTSNMRAPTSTHPENGNDPFELDADGDGGVGKDSQLIQWVLRHAADVTEEEELVRVNHDKDKQATDEALDRLYIDAVEIYDRAREEVKIPRKDGTEQRYAANRFKQQIDKGHDDGMIVPTIARIVRKPTDGFDHLKNAGRHDLMVENLVTDSAKPYHHLFSEQTVKVAEKRMAEYA
jgi:hypothetical protein